MQLSDEDYKTLEYLLKIDDIIYNLYFDNDPKKNIANLNNALDMEQDLLMSLNINDFNFDEVIEWAKAYTKDFPTVDLLIGTSPLLKRETYPFFRILTNLKTGLNSRNPLNSNFVDKEVAILYTFLKKLSIRRPDLKEKFQKYSYRILIDSRNAERELILRDFEAPKSILTAYNYDRCQYLLYNVINRLLFRILHEQQKQEPNLENRAEFHLLLDYLKTVLLYIKPVDRRAAVESIFKEKPFDPSALNLIPTLKKFIEPIYEELEELENTNIKHLSLM